MLESDQYWFDLLKKKKVFFKENVKFIFDFKKYLVYYKNYLKKYFLIYDICKLKLIYLLRL